MLMRSIKIIKVVHASIRTYFYINILTYNSQTVWTLIQDIKDYNEVLLQS